MSTGYEKIIKDSLKNINQVKGDYNTINKDIEGIRRKIAQKQTEFDKNQRRIDSINDDIAQVDMDILGSSGETDILYRELRGMKKSTENLSKIARIRKTIGMFNSFKVVPEINKDNVLPFAINCYYTYNRKIAELTEYLQPIIYCLGRYWAIDKMAKSLADGIITPMADDKFDETVKDNFVNLISTDKDITNQFYGYSLKGEFASITETPRHLVLPRSYGNLSTIPDGTLGLVVDYDDGKTVINSADGDELNVPLNLSLDVLFNETPPNQNEKNRSYMHAVASALSVFYSKKIRSVELQVAYIIGLALSYVANDAYGNALKEKITGPIKVLGTRVKEGAVLSETASGLFTNLSNFNAVIDTLLHNIRLFIKLTDLSKVWEYGKVKKKSMNANIFISIFK